jgi:hypothetical protein
MSGGRKEENTSGGIHYVQGKGGGRLEKWPYLADKCRASHNNYKLGPFLIKTPRCLGFLVFHILCIQYTKINPVMKAKFLTNSESPYSQESLLPSLNPFKGIASQDFRH